MAYKIRKNDEVLVTAGSNKGQSGKIISINRTNNTVIVDKVNMVKKHQKPTQSNPDGGIVEKEAPIHISNVMVKERGKGGLATKVGFKVNSQGKKIRYAKKSGKEL